MKLLRDGVYATLGRYLEMMYGKWKNVYSMCMRNPTPAAKCCMSVACSITGVCAPHTPKSPLPDWLQMENFSISCQMYQLVSHHIALLFSSEVNYRLHNILRSRGADIIPEECN